MAKAPEDFDITTKRDKEMRKKKMMNRYHYIKNIVMLATMMLAASCGSDGFDDELQNVTDNESPQEIRLKADVWRMMEGTRATTYDNQAALQTAGHFTCAVYQENTTTSYIDATTVDWNGSTAWEFTDGKHYWPMSGNLDFFAYMPATKPDYISSITYAVSGDPATPHPYFVCANLPMTNDGQSSSLKEFVYALTKGQSKAAQGASGVTMNFSHPFARVKFVLSAASGTNVKVNSITIPNLYTGGTYTDGTGWESLTGDVSLAISGNPATGDTFYLVVPNNYGTKTFTVNATWDDWSVVTKNVSADVTVNWQAGYSYTYTFTLSKYALKVDVAKYTEQW